MKQPRLQIGIKSIQAKNSIDGTTLELYFLDIIQNTVEFDWYFGPAETNMVEDVISQVNANKPSKIKLIIDSLGGDASIGIALYNFLKNYPAKIEVEILCMAASIATVLSMAANKGKLSMARNGFYVIHVASGMACGTAKEIREAAAVVDKYTETIVDIYAQRTGKTPEEISALMADGDYWMSGQEALDMGFVDSLFNENETVVVTARLDEAKAYYTNIPQVSNEAETTEEITEVPDETIESSFTNFFMDLKAKFTDAVDKMKGTKPTNKAEGLELQIANVVSGPLMELAGEIETEVTNELEGMVEKITNTVTATVTASYKETIEGLEKKIADLEADVTAKVGGETKDKGIDNGIKPIGTGVVRK